MDLCMPKAERAESTPSSQKAPEAGYKKNSLQSLSPSIRTFARETEKAECGERLIIYNRVKVVHLSFQCCTSSTRT